MKRTWMVLPALLAGMALAGCETPQQTLEAANHYADGQLAAEDGDFDTALAELSKAIKADPLLSLAYAAIGDIHRKHGRYHEAAHAYDRACEHNPYAFRAHYNLGVTYQLLASVAETAQAATEYVRKAVVVYLRAVVLRPNDFDVNLNLSACYFQEGKYDLAEQYCRAAVNIDPQSPFALSNLGIIHDVQGRPYDSIKAYKASLELDTHQPKLLLNLGSTYMKLGRLKSAQRAYELAIKEDPEFSPGWEQLGSCHYLQKDWSGALDAYKKSAEMDPTNAGALRGIGVVHMTRYLSDRSKADLCDQALRAWHRSLELDSDQPHLMRLVQKYTPRFTGSEL